jgi:uncharacterized phage protein (TIGR02218 family)
MAKDVLTYHELTIIQPDGSQITINSSGNAGVSVGTNATSGFKAVSVEKTRTLEANIVNIAIPIESNGYVNLTRTLTSSVALDGFNVRYSLIADGVRKPLLVGKINKLELTEQMLKVNIIEHSSRLAHGQVFRISRTCRNTFGDTACGYNLASVTFAFVIGGIAADRLSFTVTAPMVFGEYNDGTVNWTGTNLKSDIAFNDGTQVFLFDEVPNTIQIGNTISLTRGCGRDFSACTAYNNTVNFGGIPSSDNYLIGSSRAIAATKNLR